MGPFRFIYDGYSLPMIENTVTGEVWRILRLEDGKWQALATEADYFLILGVMKNGGES